MENSYEVAIEALKRQKAVIEKEICELEVKREETKGRRFAIIIGGTPCCSVKFVDGKISMDGVLLDIKEVFTARGGSTFITEEGFEVFISSQGHHKVTHTKSEMKMVEVPET